MTISGLTLTGGDGNLIGDPSGKGIIDPMLAPLADNGGSTQTHALLSFSPALDAGDPGFTPPPDLDQRGGPFSRVFGGRIDMGAYERHTGDMDFDGDVDFDDIEPLVLGLRDSAGYETQYGAPPNSNGDTDGDGDLDFDDIPGYRLCRLVETRCRPDPHGQLHRNALPTGVAQQGPQPSRNNRLASILGAKPYDEKPGKMAEVHGNRTHQPQG